MHRHTETGFRAGNYNDGVFMMVELICCGLAPTTYHASVVLNLWHGLAPPGKVIRCGNGKYQISLPGNSDLKQQCCRSDGMRSLSLMSVLTLLTNGTYI